MKDIFKTKNCIRCFNIFKSNPLIQEDDICSTCERMNSITFWYPVLHRQQFPTPKTIIVNADVELGYLIDDKIPKKAVRFLKEMSIAIDEVGLPAFIRTEMLSNKHDWKHSCFLEKKEDLIGHLKNLIEMSSIARIDVGVPHDFFAVREMIPTESYFTYFAGDMPITKEVRVFVKNGKIVCKHPYWPADIFKEIDKEKIKSLRELSKDDEEETNKMAEYVSRLFSGYWSVDLLKSKTGEWFCTDMAIGERSWHDKTCSKISNKSK